MADETPRRFDSRIFLGLVLIGFGVLFLLDNFGYTEIGSVWHYSPLIVVVFGIQKLIKAENPQQTGGGMWLVFIGLWLFVSMNEYWDLGFHETWPFLIIGWGVGVIWKSLGRPLPFSSKGTLT
ncbi:MAG: hypothetical protein A2X67_06080 [Ignavibacteria bacterium GWA2_55_11]|nr:MAG: hypothetical protein A2X67_06080 [Ignavibacteria bacterium GWA2_55_11]OGU45221.1 MAG: hypothetical protein A2X68_09240 [Ignavibacteria bacterium GWC2_56_12]OGU76506.1 MAG: hypothetical protein A3G43_06935 [Ignavibacteria bacterium RIFCSPLOWO2_12_FULL_56_21]HAV24296.1 hypothetical protein [Bacteroidota bacterium]